MNQRLGGVNNRGAVGIPIESWPEDRPGDSHLFASCLDQSLFQEFDNDSIVNLDRVSEQSHRML